MKKIDKIIIGTNNNGKFKEISHLLPKKIYKISSVSSSLVAINEVLLLYL